MRMQFSDFIKILERSSLNGCWYAFCRSDQGWHVIEYDHNPSHDMSIIMTASDVRSLVTPLITLLTNHPEHGFWAY